MHRVALLKAWLEDHRDELGSEFASDFCTDWNWHGKAAIVEVLKAYRLWDDEHITAALNEFEKTLYDLS